MKKSYITGRNQDFYDLGKKMFDRLNPQIAHNPKVIGPVQEPAAWMVYTQDGQSVYVTDNPTDIQEGQRALPLYAIPQQRPWVGLTEWEREAIALECGAMSADWLVFMEAVEKALKEKNQ